MYHLRILGEEQDTSHWYVDIETKGGSCSPSILSIQGSKLGFATYYLTVASWAITD